MRRLSQMTLCLAIAGLAPFALADAGRYLSWVDDSGQVHNTFVEAGFGRQQRQAEQRISQSDRARLRDDGSTRWPGSQPAGESKRRYFTWVDGQGNLQNSFYAANQVPGGRADYVLPSGERSSEYIDAEAYEDKGFVRSENGNPYYTWVDEQGRMHNSPISAEERAAGIRRSQIAFSDGRQVEFDQRPQALPGLDGAGEQSDAMKALLKGSGKTLDDLYQDLQRRCCEQIGESDFTELSADQPRYEELNKFSPSFDFPMGKSYYVAMKLPHSQQVYGLRVRSFANHQVVYPSLLFLDEHKRPTRLVSDAVYKLNPETWYRYAFIEGTVPVRANQGERYVLLLTTDEDRSLQTLDNKPYKRPLQDLSVNEAGMQVHAHADQGGFELAVVR
ncbi:Maltose operon substrate-binding protein precursor (MalM) [Pseudomonas panipatensis]|uniref:Maltose operon substrate-binding protein (MalM) n=2 Tax=Pseudomonas panipatensis TaxID=428992 RepID=A0A1G8F9S2_9PSED|nr:MalM family protein [Pseudomonas panipatensis]SDH78857.1 Maltose operon substrate-binding protein precursor (MalM) [Pseudomonas panipatensis]SMP54876.1 Maltose operon substrate-binding protein precursor (MalM) [Pseudomonas panipatensis]